MRSAHPRCANFDLATSVPFPADPVSRQALPNGQAQTPARVEVDLQVQAIARRVSTKPFDGVLHIEHTILDILDDCVLHRHRLILSRHRSRSPPILHGARGGLGRSANAKRIMMAVFESGRPY